MNNHYSVVIVGGGQAGLSIKYCDRIPAKYGRPCGLALGQLQEIEIKSAQYSHLSQPKAPFIFS